MAKKLQILGKIIEKKSLTLEKIENKWLKLKNTFSHEQQIVLEGRNVLIIDSSWMSVPKANLAWLSAFPYVCTVN